MSRIAALAFLLWCIEYGTASTTEVTIGDRTLRHTWLSRASMPTIRSDMTATTVGDKIFLIGGCAMDQVWTPGPAYSGYSCGSGLASAITSSTIAYLPLSDKYETSLPNAPRARYRHAAAAIGPKIYVFGGKDGVDNTVAEIDVFDTETNTWTTLANPMPNPTTDLAAFAHNNGIYTLGGYTNEWVAETRVQLFNPLVEGASAWTQGPSLRQGRGDTFATIVGESAFVMGGFHDGNNFASPLDSVERLDVSASGASWAVRGRMAVGRGDKAVAVVHDLIHVIGGETKNEHQHSVPLRDVEVYDHAGDKWHFGGDIPSDRFRFTAASHGENIYIFGGQGFLTGTYGDTGSAFKVLDTVEVYSEKETRKNAPKEVSGSVGHGFMAALVSVALVATLQ